jgi:hypothetical protein
LGEGSPEGATGLVLVVLAVLVVLVALIVLVEPMVLVMLVVAGRRQTAVVHCCVDRPLQS